VKLRGRSALRRSWQKSRWLGRRRCGLMRGRRASWERWVLVSRSSLCEGVGAWRSGIRSSGLASAVRLQWCERRIGALLWRRILWLVRSGDGIPSPLREWSVLRRSLVVRRVPGLGSDDVRGGSTCRCRRIRRRRRCARTRLGARRRARELGVGLGRGGASRRRITHGDWGSCGVTEVLHCDGA
jgi:hypothetical protein